MKIVINRDSVCMGDDMNDHTKVFRLPRNSTYRDLFDLIMKEKYLSQISGNNNVWVLASSKFECIFSYYTRTNKFFPGLAEDKLSIICEDNNELIFKYFSSPLKWKESIENMYGGVLYDIWKDGWLDECKYCDYLMSLGSE